MEEKNPVSSAAELFTAAPVRRFKLVALPVMGLTVRIRSLTERELTAYTSAVVSNDAGQTFRRARVEDATRRLIALCLVDPEGNRLLSDADAGRLAEWDSADTQHLYNEITPFVGLKRGDVDDLVKN
jgi:hypothetical protein